MSRSFSAAAVSQSVFSASITCAFLLGSSDDAAAQNRSQRIGIDLGPVQIGIGEPWRPVRPIYPVTPEPNPWQPEVPRYQYLVREIHPGTGGVYRSKRFSDRLTANAYRDEISRVHWVQWRFVGINEPMRYRRFDNASLAQQFINTNGPARSGALGTGFLTGETRMLPAKVRMTSERISSTRSTNSSTNRSTVVEQPVVTKAKPTRQRGNTPQFVTFPTQGPRVTYR